jgi:hypothetical protein
MLCQQMPLQSQGHSGVKSVVWGLKGSGHPIESGYHGHDQRRSRCNPAPCKACFTQL